MLLFQTLETNLDLALKCASKGISWPFFCVPKPRNVVSFHDRERTMEHKKFNLTIKMSEKQTSRLLQSGRLLSWFVQRLQLHHQDPCLPRCFSGNLASTQQHGCDCARPRPAGALITSCTCSCQPVLLTGTVQPELSSAVLQLHGMGSSMPADSCLQGGLLFSVCYPQRLVTGGLKAPAAILCLNLCLYYLQGRGTAWQRCAA